MEVDEKYSVSMRCQHLRIPAIVPPVVDGSLWAPVNDTRQGKGLLGHDAIGLLLALCFAAELRGAQQPGMHRFVVGSREIEVFGSRQVEFRQAISVEKGELCGSGRGVIVNEDRIAALC